MSSAFGLIVTDTSPLITLALARSLDAMLRPGIPISIPDAVYIEATRLPGAPGAEEIVEWINGHLDAIRIVPTDIGIDQQRRFEDGRKTRGMGEVAAMEVLDRFLLLQPQAEAMLLFEDSDIERRRAAFDDRVTLVSTGSFLRLLESTGLIQSADHILDLAADRGRNVEKLRRARADERAALRLGERLR